MANLKITKEHLALLEEMVEAAKSRPTFLPLEQYLAAGLTAKRWRWDLVWASPVETRHRFFDSVYIYANDDHVDSALRQITQTK